MTENSPISKCPACGEPVQPGWRICPVCETRLQAPACPACSRPVQENWKRCPECEALLICSECRRRLPQGAQSCPNCAPTDAGPQAPVQPPVQSQGKGQPPPLFTDSACGIEMVYVQGGRFEMGDTLGQGFESELPVHSITLDGFYIGRHPVTQAQWQVLVPSNPSRFEGPHNPVEQVTWDEARRFARLLSDAYKGRYRFDLPSEAQWEYAARSGGQDQLYAGGDRLEDLGWYEDNSQGRTHPVGRKAPNGCALYDMSGNVWEWCLDAYQVDAYARHARHNPVVELDQGDRVMRGGSWHLDAWSARCARRFSCPRDFMGPGLGFRLVMIPQDY